MARMKKFFLYFVMLVALYIFVTALTNFEMKDNFKEIADNQIEIASPKINIDESKATYSHGYIKGTITNDSGEHIKDKYLQFDFYDKDGIYLGTEKQEIKYFNVNEKIKFDIQYNYNNVNKIKINFVNEVIEPERYTDNIISLDENLKELALPVGLIMGLYAILP